MQLVSTFVVALFLTFLASGSGKKMTFHDGKYELEWLYEAEDLTSILFKVTVKDVKGWIAVGFSPEQRGMKNADMVIGEVNDNGLDVKDYKSESLVVPTKDARQDLDYVSTNRDEKAGTTFMQFRKKLNSGDTEQDIVLPTDGIYILWAVCDQPKITSQHTHRGFSEQKVTFEVETNPARDKSPGTAATGSASVMKAFLTFILPALCILTCFKQFDH